MSVEILVAKIEDIPHIHGLLKELAVFQHLESDFKIDENKLCELIFEEKSVNALVAFDGKDIVGTALYYTSGVSTFSGRHILCLEDIYVKEDNRKSGIGREFFKKLREIAKEYNCCKIEWKCQSWNVNAGHFYKLMGSKQEDGWTAFSINHI